MKTPKPAAALGEDLLAYLLASLVAMALAAGVGEVAATVVGEVAVGELGKTLPSLECRIVEIHETSSRSNYRKKGLHL
jgi:long-subunit acyl-CoA synthetase (AMP-forming)